MYAYCAAYESFSLKLREVVDDCRLYSLSNRCCSLRDSNLAKSTSEVILFSPLLTNAMIAPIILDPDNIEIRRAKNN